MRMHLPRYFVIFCVLLVYTLTAQTGAHGYVLCLGNDGRVAIEVNVNNECGPTVQDSTCEVITGEPIPFDEDHSLPCLDVTTSRDIALKRDGQGLDNPPIPVKSLAAPISLPPSVSSIYRPTQVLHELAHVSQTLRAHRTVVLLN